MKMRNRFRCVWTVSGVAGGVFLVWLAAIAAPSSLFYYRVQRSNVVFHSRIRLPGETMVFLDEAIRRISYSPLYSENDKYDVFLCDSPALFEALTFGARGGGITNFWSNVFIRPGDIRQGRVFDRHGNDRAKDRDLVYYTAHELTHAMALRKFGFLASHRLPAFQREGYADYVGRGASHDLAAEKSLMAANGPEVDPKQSGLYMRYEILVAYLIECRGISVQEVLTKPYSQKLVEEWFRAASSCQ
jgi:hypothetical protein